MNRTNSRSGMFLLEIMLSILFFSIASALCLQMFTRTRQTSIDTTNLAQATDHVRNAAELLKYAAKPANGDSGEAFFPDCLLQEYADAFVSSDKIQIYFDENWKHCTVNNGVYCMEAAASQTETEGLFGCSFTVFETESEESIYSLDLKLHIPNQP